MESLLRFLSRIWIRLLAFNALLVFLPAVGILTFHTYEQKLLDRQERSMVQQARLLAAALGGDEVEGSEAELILTNLRQQIDARLRVYDRDLQVLADSSLLGPRSDAPEGALAAAATERETRDSLLYRLGTVLYGLYERVFLPPQPPLPESELDATVEEVRARVVRGALEGGYRAGSAVSPERRSLTLYSAIPIRDGDGEVAGVALASKSTFQILQDLYDLRLSTFKVVLLSVAAAIVLSLVVATTIARPLHKLRSQAKAILDRRGRLKGGFQGWRRRDEIGDLSRALAELTRRLRRHIEFIESFASDVSHEFKNPLATIRTATELLAEVEDPGERQRFLTMILDDIARLEHLLSEVREITQIDATLEDEPVEPVDLDRLLRALVERYEMQSPGRVVYRSAAGSRPTVYADPERLARVFENLLDNAISFSPADGEVAVELAAARGDAVITLRDRGPGIPEEHLERIFDRFFSYRQRDEGHTGLGLAIVKTIVDGYGGRVSAANAEDGGAVFEIRLPRE